MVIVAILSPLLPPGGQSNHKADRDVAHHTSHHTHLSIHPIPPKEKKKKAITVTVSQPSRARAENPPVMLPGSPPLTSPSRKAPKPGTRHRQASRHLRTKQKRKTGCLHTYIHTYITYTRRYVEEKRICYSIPSLTFQPTKPSSSPK